MCVVCLCYSKDKLEKVGRIKKILESEKQNDNNKHDQLHKHGTVELDEIPDAK